MRPKNIPDWLSESEDLEALPLPHQPFIQIRNRSPVADSPASIKVHHQPAVRVALRQMSNNEMSGRVTRAASTKAQEQCREGAENGESTTWRGPWLSGRSHQTGLYIGQPVNKAELKWCLRPAPAPALGSAPAAVPAPVLSAGIQATRLCLRRLRLVVGPLA